MPRKVLTVVLALMLAGCGDGQAAPQPPMPSPSPSSLSPTPSAAEDGRTADDVDKDGYADLALQFDVGDRRHLAVVHGSRRGLDPSKRTVVSSDTFSSWPLDGGTRADLDGDGFGDVLGYGYPAGREAQQGPHIFWGGARGIAAKTLPTPVRLPGVGESAAHRAVAGDFDGDGAADVAMGSPPRPGASDTDLAVLYGPFSREGVPSRQTTQPSPTGREFWRLTADGRHPTGLIVYEGDDGEQTAGWLLRAGPGGLSKAGRKLNAGLASAFGDFDGDGAGDVAVGDDASRNNEPGYETEPPSVDRTLTVYYGDGRHEAFKGVAGQAVAGDFDGDGRDDLAFGGSAHLSRTPTRIFWGGPGGLRGGGEVDGAGRAVPLAAADFDGDGDDELAFTHDDDGLTVTVTDGTKVLTRFDTSSLVP